MTTSDPRPGTSLIQYGGPQHDADEELARLELLAQAWENRTRSRRLLLPQAMWLRGERALREARQRGLAPTSSLRELVEESRRRGRWARGLKLVGGGATLTGVVMFVAMLMSRTAPVTPSETSTELTRDPLLPSRDESVGSHPARRPRSVWIEHEVVPTETVLDVAERYDVAQRLLARWNKLDPDSPLEAGSILRVKPKRRPLPQQRISYDVEVGESWKRLSQRFKIPVSKLRAYNPDRGKKLRAGTTLAVWIDPKPHVAPARPVPLPQFSLRQDAVSNGGPNAGTLVAGIQLPRSELYVRHRPNLMYGSSHAVENLMRGIALFRRDMAFEGVVVVMDMSRRGGGPFSPHKSHQSGRDADVWLPRLRGVYKKDHLGKNRKPQPNEVDWFATWGLVRALVATGEVRFVFIEYKLMEKVYQAAVLSGAPQSELGEAMQWPRGQYASGTLRHSARHTRHIHVRFKCGPQDKSVGCIP
ncbi:MAG: penicillin-insensitive murein endopeptidase [Nannocystaceae bacterium]